MAHVDSYAQGRPNWIDLSTSDPEAATTFYSALFGWEFEANDTGGGPPYFIGHLDGRRVAGLMQQPPDLAAQGVPSSWNNYVATDDIEATVAAGTAAGGTTLMPPMDVMDTGRMAIMADPNGAVIGFWQAGTHIGAGIVNVPGTWSWSELHTADVPAAVPFYAAACGWTTVDMDMGPMGTYTVFQLGEDGMCGAMSPPVEGIPPHWETVFAVDDTDATVETARAAGATVHAEPFDIPEVGRSAVLADPTGAVFQVIRFANQPD